jgi:FeS assembly protein IscX
MQQETSGELVFRDDSWLVFFLETPGMAETLDWDASFAVAKALQHRYPQIEIESVSLEMVYRWAIALPDFIDEPVLANNEVLAAIYREWLELIGTARPENTHSPGE